MYGWMNGYMFVCKYNNNSNSKNNSDINNKYSNNEDIIQHLCFNV